ncbi:MAG TPA: sulfatase [Planctomycetota bacterium]|nr:sulfatase [Planctomycetota bacterium]
MNVITINADTFRRDHLGAYGNTWISTPNLDRFAAESVVFDRAYAASFPTVPNRLDVLTGRFTFTYRGWAPLPEDALCFPKLLNDAGCTTMMICDTPHILQKGYNFQRDFSAFDWIRGQENDRLRTHPREVTWPCDPAKIRSGFTASKPVKGAPSTLTQHLRNTADRQTEADCFAARTLGAASDWLEHNHADGPFYLYVDTFDPHEPWDPPAYYTWMYDPGYRGDEVTYPRYDFCDYLTKAELNHCRAMYAGECTLVDRWVGRLLAKIDDLGLRENTVVVFTTDHGFLHGEHGIIGKSIIRKGAMSYCPLWEEIARIPLMVRHPKVPGGRRVNAFVQPPDFAPTILDAAGVDVPDVMQGRSLLPLLRGRVKSIRDFAVTSPALVADALGAGTYIPSTVTTSRWSLIYSSPRGTHADGATTRAVDSVERRHVSGLFPELLLYDLARDPAQKRNVARKHPDVVRRLHRKYVRLLEDLGTDEDRLAPRRVL